MRSYLYLLFHYLVGLPASMCYNWLEEEKVQISILVHFMTCTSFLSVMLINIIDLILNSFQVRVFYAVRIFLGIISVITEAALVVAISRKYGKRLACYTLALLCLTSGCFFASTGEYSSNCYNIT